MLSYCEIINTYDQKLLQRNKWMNDKNQYSFWILCFARNSSRMFFKIGVVKTMAKF